MRSRLKVRPVLFVAAMMSILIVAPARADTTGGPADFDGAYANDVGGTVFVEVFRDNLNGGALSLFVHLTTSTPITCLDSSNGTLATEFAGSSPPASATFGSHLSSASASGLVTGTLTTTDSCAGTSIDTSASHSASLILAGSKPITSTTTRTKTVNSDGTTTVLTSKFSQTVATGDFSVDGTVMTATGAAIFHGLATERTH